MLSQSFGDSVATNEADNVTAIEFDSTGNYLATGDRGGRIVVFRGVKTDPRKSSRFAQQAASKMWSPYFQFQSHESDFDYLKSLEIEEKIGQIKFCPSVGNNLLLLTTNDKTVKLWRVYDKCMYSPGAQESLACGGGLSLPRASRSEVVTQSSLRRCFQNAHTYNINSIAVSSDGETFSSADDLRINLWNMDYSDKCFTLSDIKPSSMEDLQEVITSSQFSPGENNLLLYSTSRGSIKVVDTRVSAMCDSACLVLEEPEDAASKTFFSEISNSVSDFKISADGRFVTSRDYLSIKVWDRHMNAGPVVKYAVHDHLRPSMHELYETESIFDKFSVSVSPDGSSILSGSYSNQFSIWNKVDGSRNIMMLPLPPPGPRYGAAAVEGNRFSKEIYIPCPDGHPAVRADQKVLHCAWHPTDNTIAVAGQAGLYLYKV